MGHGKRIKGGHRLQKLPPPPLFPALPESYACGPRGLASFDPQNGFMSASLPLGARSAAKKEYASLDFYLKGDAVDAARNPLCNKLSPMHRPGCLQYFEAVAKSAQLKFTTGKGAVDAIMKRDSFWNELPALAQAFGLMVDSVKTISAMRCDESFLPAASAFLDGIKGELQKRLPEKGKDVWIEGISDADLPKIAEAWKYLLVLLDKDQAYALSVHLHAGKEPLPPPKQSGWIPSCSSSGLGSR